MRPLKDHFEQVAFDHFLENQGEVIHSLLFHLLRLEWLKNRPQVARLFYLLGPRLYKPVLYSFVSFILCFKNVDVEFLAELTQLLESLAFCCPFEVV